MIPAMTHPLGQFWRQPPRERILVDDTHALMSTEDFAALADYTGSQPTGAYEGKMWKSRGQLVWFDTDPADPKYLVTHRRPVLLVEAEKLAARGGR